MDGTSGATGDHSGDGSAWLTYAELGARLGISAASAKRRANKRRWPKRLNNSGLSTVAVPREVLEAGPHRRRGDAEDTSGDAPKDGTGDDPNGYKVLAEHLKAELEAARRGQLAAEAGLWARMAELAEARERVARAEGEATVLRQALDVLTADLRAALKETVRPRSRGLWGRLWGRG
jgi:hypothetical protein